jgi:hypothetical protein
MGSMHTVFEPPLSTLRRLCARIDPAVIGSQRHAPSEGNFYPHKNRKTLLKIQQALACGRASHCSISAAALTAPSTPTNCCASSRVVARKEGAAKTSCTADRIMQRMFRAPIVPFCCQLGGHTRRCQRDREEVGMAEGLIGGVLGVRMKSLKSRPRRLWRVPTGSLLPSQPGCRPAIRRSPGILLHS